MMNKDGTQSRVNGYVTDILTDDAMEWLKKDRNKPFCLYLAHKAVHDPRKPAARHENLYDGVKFPHSPNCYDKLEGKPEWVKNSHLMWSEGQTHGIEAADEVIRQQLRCLASVDEGIGRILDQLANSGQLENTVVALAGDNGYYIAEHGLGDKRSAYEESMLIPLIMSYPKMIKPGAKIKNMVLNNDFAPTMLELAGIKAPDCMQGKSMVPLFKGNDKGWRKEFFYEYMSEPQYPQIPNVLAVRTEQVEIHPLPRDQGD